MAKLNGIKGFNYRRLAQEVLSVDEKIENVAHADGFPVEDWTFAMSDFTSFILKNAQRAGLSDEETVLYANKVLSLMGTYLSFDSQEALSR